MVTGYSMARERRLVGRLRAVRAVSDASAQPLEVGALDGRVLRRLQAAGVVREARGQRWFLDEAAYEAYRQARRLRMALVLAGVVVLLVLGLFWFRS
jgi:hypothetical protein